ncbi:MAG TPA: S49 family peptidase [Flavobacterium sp.]|nr:S49 family peptidase [Flavobacterium sp.]
MKKFVRLALELQRGAWAISPEALEIFGPLAYKIVTGTNDVSEMDSPKSCLSFFDGRGNRLRADEDGYTEIPEGSIAVVEMIGPLVKYGDWCTYGADDLVLALEMADNHPNVIGTILRVDGPGGSVSAVGPFVEFGKRKQKPIVALYDMACSAHLWTMLAVADHIMAENNISSLIGSIGVVLHWVDNRKYLESIGYEFHEVYPEESKHKNEAARLAMEGKYDLIKKEMLSPMAIQFQEFVKSKRPNLNTKETGVLTGKTFGADKALELGFIDTIGSFRDARQMVEILTELKKVNN